MSSKCSMYEHLRISISFEFIKKYLNSNPSRILIVGCGNGTEALTIHKLLSIPTIGIDAIKDFIEPIEGVTLIRGNARALPFLSNVFDIIYCSHVLEHIVEYQKVLSECKRVLHQNGVFYLAIPNKRRIMGYFLSKVNIWTKIKWNLKDFRDKISGSFCIEKGSHAGFNRREIKKELSDRFSSVQIITKEYACTYAKVKIPRFWKLVRFFINIAFQQDRLFTHHFINIKGD